MHNQHQHQHHQLHHLHHYPQQQHHNHTCSFKNYNNALNHDLISIKSRIGVEFRRYALKREDVQNFHNFYKKIEAFHQLSAIPFVIFYTDSEDFLLPINNNDNLAKAISSAKLITRRDRESCSSINQNFAYNNNGAYTFDQGWNRDGSNFNSSSSYVSNNIINNNDNFSSINLSNNAYGKSNHNYITTFKSPFLKLYIEKKGIFLDIYNGNLTGKYKKHQHFKNFSNLFSPLNEQNLKPSIGMPVDFRQVSSIIDVDLLPETCRRVRIVKHGSDRPLGFYIRDGTYKRINSKGRLELVTGTFISRLVPGGLAESTGLLAVNDEVLEVNGIQVTHGKTLDQVTDMMVANSSNLILTIRPGKIDNLS